MFSNDFVMYRCSNFNHIKVPIVSYGTSHNTLLPRFKVISSCTLSRILMHPSKHHLVELASPCVIYIYIYICSFWTLRIVLPSKIFNVKLCWIFVGTLPRKDQINKPIRIIKTWPRRKEYTHNIEILYGLMLHPPEKDPEMLC